MKLTYISEGIIPLNFNFKAYTNSYNNYNNSINNKILQDNSYNVFNICINAINNLIIGNTTSTFNTTDTCLLENSIRNKIKEILDSCALSIIKQRILDLATNYVLLNQHNYANDIKRYNLDTTNYYIGINLSNNIIKVNPKLLHNIISNWCATNSVNPNLLNNSVLIFD